MGKKGVSSFKGSLISKSALFSRVIIGLIFIYSGSIKFLNLNLFALSINNYHLIPQNLSLPFACFLSSAEVILGVLFLFGVFIKETGLLLIILNLVFIGAMVSAMLRGIDISCGCFSPDGESLGFIDVIRDLFFILFVIYGMWGERYGQSND